MRRIRFALLTLVFVLALPAAAGAQLPYLPGPLSIRIRHAPGLGPAPGRSASTPRTGRSAWRRRSPTWPTAPLGIDPRAVDPSAPNPLLGQRFFVDRMEPAYIQWVKWKRAGETTKAEHDLEARPRAAVPLVREVHRRRGCRRRCAASSTACSATSPAPCR